MCVLLGGLAKLMVLMFLTYVAETLEYFSVNPESTINRGTSIKAQALLTHISNFNFIVSLVIKRKVFGFTHSVTALLQATSNDIINGLELIGSLIDLMSNIRINIDKYHDEWYSEACKLAQKINVNESVPRTCARQTARENFPAESPSHYYKLSLSIPLIDTVLSELKKRFEGNQKCIFEGLYLIPYIMVGSLKNNISMSWKDHFKIFLKFYESDFEDLSFKSLDAELSLWEHHWENCSANLPDNVSATLKQISFPCFPFIKRALRILGTIPVSSCACERSFSSMKLLKTYNRSTMTNNRLNALAMLYVHLDIHPSSEEVLKRFIAHGPHRLNFNLE